MHVNPDMLAFLSLFLAVYGSILIVVLLIWGVEASTLTGFAVMVGLLLLPVLAALVHKSQEKPEESTKQN